jgi:predicted AlkP superfamily phosphohydrolase/phosphomutase
MLNYYVDPGSGFVFVQGTSVLWALILGFLGSALFLFKFFFRFLKKIFWFFFVLLIALVIGGFIMLGQPKTKTKVIILGIDAMDPNITEQLMNEGELPNLSYLKASGSYSRLATTIPSESVVAWTSFATGLNPGSHGIFDFIMRDPRTYCSYLSLNEITTIRSSVKIKIRKKGEAFWNILSKNKIPSFIYFCPNTFPPNKILGKMISGMGVPDIQGTMGKFSFYTTKKITKEDKDSRGRIIQVKPNAEFILTELCGPKVSSKGKQTESNAPLKINLIPKEEKVFIELHKNRFFLKKGSWSDWLKVSFKVGLFTKVHGIVRLYLKSLEPDFELYASPINFDPQDPPFAISYPSDYSLQLAKKIGIYYTQGMPHDTWALTENRLDEKAFLELSDEIMNEKVNILTKELTEFKSGLFFFYFDTLDIIQHMFWRYTDSLHPLYENSPFYRGTIIKYYKKIDNIIGGILKKIDKDTTLIILSDHGFNSFRRSVHLNRWLLENGYLFLKEGAGEDNEFLEDVDWHKTKAYALGFGGIYLNKIGREYYGIVNDSEALSLKQEIIKGLKEFKDPKTGKMIVSNVYVNSDVFKGPYMNDAPDLFVGFNRGYRASWQTALGNVPGLLIEDNMKKWSGDHLIDSRLVSGVIFINRKAELDNPQITDIAPTALSLFNIDKPEEMQGRILFKAKHK